MNVALISKGLRLEHRFWYINFHVFERSPDIKGIKTALAALFHGQSYLNVALISKGLRPHLTDTLIGVFSFERSPDIKGIKTFSARTIF